MLTRRLLPAFGSKPLDRIAPAEVMNFAIARGYIEKNPAQGIRPNRRPKLTRFLSREEIARLHRAPDAETGKGNRQQADIVRLLLRMTLRYAHLGDREIEDAAERVSQAIAAIMGM